MKLVTKEYEEKMKKAIVAYQQEIATIRVGRANIAVLDRVSVDYYGAPTAISQMAEVKVTDAKTLLIQPWDATTLKAIDKAIQASDIGIQPQNDGKVIRLVFPQLTEERRKDITKQLAKMGEDAKVAIRNVRRDANEKCKELKKKSEMSEDEVKASEKTVQELTDKMVKELDAVTAKKQKEIMEI